MKYLFEDWDKVRKNLKGKRIFLFLDYDGTLAPIRETPDNASLVYEVRQLLEELSGRQSCRLAIISGRALKDIENLIGIKNIIYSGNHGLEIEGPKIKFEADVPVRYKAILKEIKGDLTQKFTMTKGVILEDKNLSLSVHYRMADEKDIPKIKAIFDETVSPYLVKDRIKIKSGKMVLEIAPPLKWDKGKVILWLLARERFASKGRGVFPIYIGDDKSDEDAFKAIRGKGLTILVGEDKFPRALYYLKDTDEVMRFLKEILKIETPS